MPVEHSGAGVPHHISDSFSHDRLETMNRAFGASRLARLVGAFVKTFTGVLHKHCTFGAKYIAGMPFTAV